MKLGKILSVVRNVSSLGDEEFYEYYAGCTVKYEHGVRKYNCNVPSTLMKWVKRWLLDVLEKM